MMIAAVTRAERTIAVPRTVASGGDFEAVLTTQASAPAKGQNSRTSAAAAVAAFDLDYSNVEHSQADYEAYYAEGARNVSAAQGLPEGRYDFTAMTPRELRIATGHLVMSGAVKFGDIVHLAMQARPMGPSGESVPIDRATDWFAVADDQIANARARHETGIIPYLQSATAALQRFQMKSDRPAGATTLASSTSSSATGSAKLDAALEAFRKEGKMTPAERMRRQVMKDMKITEDDLKAMPPDQRDAMEKTIGEEVALRLKKLGIDGGGAGTRSVEEYVAAQG
ncbi:hypothetical protein [uncultured Sphingomonas sp.]|uniref:hypothetical protein n=1 Tax=uncultured Sphingomonas sp. TaxID=158754 RepID=UPI0025F86108|nr:hypothetical protein [uncultured Sphingomonas sp.]